VYKMSLDILTRKVLNREYMFGICPYPLKPIKILDFTKMQTAEMWITTANDTVPINTMTQFQHRGRCFTVHSEAINSGNVIGGHAIGKVVDKCAVIWDFCFNAAAYWRYLKFTCIYQDGTNKHGGKITYEGSVPDWLYASGADGYVSLSDGYEIGAQDMSAHFHRMILAVDFNLNKYIGAWINDHELAVIGKDLNDYAAAYDDEQIDCGFALYDLAASAQTGSVSYKKIGIYEVL